MADDEAAVEEQAPNPLAEKAREELAQKRNRLERRESGTVLEDKSKGFAGFPPKNAAGEGDAAADGDGAAPQAASPARPPPPGSARGSHETRTQGEQDAYGAFLLEHPHQRSVDMEPSGETGGDALEGEGGWDSQDGVSLREESLEEASWEDEGSGSLLGEASMLMTDKERVLSTRVVGGTVSGYKHKEELSEALERRAALKYIGQRKDDVTRRGHVLKEAEAA
ncbi:hypothetical protein T484DRAFT_1809089, partial [Baffinella frigidus]